MSLTFQLPSFLLFLCLFNRPRTMSSFDRDSFLSYGTFHSLTEPRMKQVHFITALTACLVWMSEVWMNWSLKGQEMCKLENIIWECQGHDGGNHRFCRLCWVGMQIWNVLLRHSPWSRIHGETSWPSYTSPLVVELKNVTSIFFPACVACTFCLLSKSNPAMKLYGF